MTKLIPKSNKGFVVVRMVAEEVQVVYRKIDLIASQILGAEVEN